MNTLKEAQAILKAMEEGIIIQIKAHDGSWIDFGITMLPNFGDDEYRIKPSTRLLTADELPDVIWIKGSDGAARLVVRTGANTLTCAVGAQLESTTIKDLSVSCVLWSDSRKGPWRSFETEVNL